MTHQDSTDTIQIVTSSGADIDVVIFYRKSGNDQSKFEHKEKITTATTTTITLGVAQKVDILELSIFNTESLNNEITIQKVESATTYVFHKVTLASNESFQYKDSVGKSVFASTGALKQSINQGANASTSGLTAVVLPSDVTNNNGVANTIADVVGLNFSVTAGKWYYFKAIIYYTAQATTTGSRWGVSCNAGTAANLSMTSEYSLTSTTTTRNANVQGFDLPAAANATSASTTNNMAVLEGYFQPTANGTFTIRFASEVAGSAIVAKAGSVLYYQQTN